jgi:hypothetical protein
MCIVSTVSIDALEGIIPSATRRMSGAQIFELRRHLSGVGRLKKRKNEAEFKGRRRLHVTDRSGAAIFGLWYADRLQPSNNAGIPGRV